MNGNRKRKLELHRETVRILTSREMSGVAGGAVKLSDLCTDFPEPKPMTMADCPTKVTVACPTYAGTCLCSFLDCNRAVIRPR